MRIRRVISKIKRRLRRIGTFCYSVSREGKFANPFVISGKYLITMKYHL